MTGNRQQWSRLAIGLHWLIAILMLLNLGLGAIAEDMALSPAQVQAFLWHKSIGLSVLALAGLRLCWRWAHPPPPPPDSLRYFEKRASALTHALLYVLMFALPLSGWWLNSAANFPFRWFGALEVPNLPGTHKDQQSLATSIHGLLAWALIALVTLHVGAALKHHVWDKDEILRRIWPGRTGRIVLLALFVGLPAAIAWNLRDQPVREDTLAATDGMVADPAQSTVSAPAWEMSRGRLGFTVSYDEVPIDGRFAKFSPRLHFSPDDLPGSHFDVRIDTGSVDTDSPDRDEVIRDEEWFAVPRFPQAHFVADRFRQTGPETFEADARLTLRGQTRQVLFPFRWSSTGGETDSRRLEASVMLDRRHFNVGTGAWADDPTVGFKVEVSVDLQLLPTP